MSIVLQGFGRTAGGIITQGYSVAAFPVYPPVEAVAAGVIFGPNGELVGKLTYDGFAATGDAPTIPPSKRRSTPSGILTKRVADIRLFDIDLTLLLDDAEQIVYVKSITTDAPTLLFSGARINPAPIYYKLLDNVAQIGKVVQVQIQGGELPYGACELLCHCRLQVVTTENPLIEAPFTVRLTDGPQ